MTKGFGAKETDIALMTYLLYFIGLFTGLASVIGLVMAYVRRDSAGSDELTNNHYTWLIRTFWLGLLYSVVGVVTAPFVVGYFILLFTVVWYIVRIVKGWLALARDETLRSATTWLF